VLDLQIVVSNKNSAPILLADLIVEFPEGTRSAVNANIELPRIRESLGTIKSGQLITTTVSSILFGEENTEKKLDIAVEYRLEDSNAIFFKEIEYEVLLNSAPLSVFVDTQREAISGQELVFDIVVSSNSVNTVDDVLFVAEYPFGFSFQSASPKPSFGSNDVWFLGDLSSGVEKKIQIRGIQIGQDQEERVFRFDAGLQSDNNEQKILAALGQSTVPLTISKPFVSLDLALNGSSDEEYIADGGLISGEIVWRNNLPVPVNDAVITLTFTGERLNTSSVDVDKGFYQSFDGSIQWSSETGSDFKLLSPGESGVAKFSFAPTSLGSGRLIRESKIRLDATVSGRRNSEQGVPETIESTVTREVLIETDFLLSAQNFYQSGPFANSGAVPPIAEQETTYTVTWSVTNSANDISNAQLTARLPNYVRWLNRVSPSNESLTYNAVSNTLTWDIGTVLAQTGYNTAPKDVSFQVGLVPSVSQVGQAPVLISEQELKGLDRFTDSEVITVHPDVTTRTADSGRTKFDGHEKVIR